MTCKFWSCGIASPWTKVTGESVKQVTRKTEIDMEEEDLGFPKPFKVASGGLAVFLFLKFLRLLYSYNKSMLGETERERGKRETKMRPDHYLNIL